MEHELLAGLLLPESMIIVIIFLIVEFALLKSRRIFYFKAVLPLALFPVIHIIGAPVSLALSKLPWLHDRINVHIGFNILGMLVICLFIGFISSGIKNRKPRLVYLFSGGGFCFILCIIYILNLLSVKP